MRKPLFPPIDIPKEDRSDLQAAKEFMQSFGRHAASNGPGPSLNRWVIGPLPGGDSLAVCIELSDGNRVSFSVSADLIESFTGNLVLGWQLAAELQLLNRIDGAEGCRKVN